MCSRELSQLLYSFVSDKSVDWPPSWDAEQEQLCVKRYYDATAFVASPPCAVCGCVPTPAVSLTTCCDLLKVKSHEQNSLLPGLPRLLVDTDYFKCQGIILGFLQQFLLESLICAEDPSLNYYIIEKRGLVTETDGSVSILMCESCYRSLSVTAKKVSLPHLALGNSLWRGCLPDKFSDLTWMEEAICVRWRALAHIVWIYDTGKSVWKLKGTVCAVPQNLSSVAKVLPDAPLSVGAIVLIAFVGTRPPECVPVSKLFRIWRGKVLRFLEWLKENNPLYADIDISKENVELYPEDNMPEDLWQVIIRDIWEDAGELHADETSGLSEHPSELIDDDDDTDISFLKKQALLM